MGWGIEFTPDIYLSRMSFNTVGELKEQIKETEAMIKWYREKLLILASSTPNSITPEEDEEPLFYLQREFSDAMEGLEEYIVLSTNLHHLLDYVKENPEFKMTSV